MKFHPYSEVFPLLSDERLVELAEDIKAHGLREPIWKYQGQILDGRNRYLACQKAKVKPVYQTFKGDDDEALTFVVSLNIQRRHLSDAQRAFAAAKIVTMRQGERTDLAPRGAKSQSQAAEDLGVSRRSVQRAKQVIEHGSKALQNAVQQGEVPLKKAAEVVDLPKSEQLAAATAEVEFAITEYDPADDEAAIASADRAFHESMGKIVDSDDRFAEFQAEIKRLSGQLAVTEGSRDHYMNQAGEAVRLLKAEKRRTARLTKQLEESEAEIKSLRQKLHLDSQTNGAARESRPV